MYSCAECRESVCEDCFDDLAEQSCLVCAEDLKHPAWEDDDEEMVEEDTEPE